RGARPGRAGPGPAARAGGGGRGGRPRPRRRCRHRRQRPAPVTDGAAGPGRGTHLGRRLPVTGPPAQVTEPGSLRQVGAGIGRAAVLIGAITVLARLVGFGRQRVFAHTVGDHFLGTAYATAHQAPNIVDDIVLGG